MPDFLLPDLGEGLTEAEIVAWRVAVGDSVTVDQPVVEVETAKAVVEVPVPFGGVVSALHGAAGSSIAVGSPLITVAVDGAAGAEPGEPASRTRADDATGSESGNVLIGYGTSAAGASRRRRGTRQPGRGTAASLTPAAAPSADASVVDAVPAARTRTAGSARVISPLVRKLARDAGLDPATLTGSGPDGMVLRRDVEQAIARSTPAVERPAEGATARSAHAEAADATDHHETRIPLRGLRKLAADRLSRSRREIPEATVWVDVDATELLAARAALNARHPEEPVSLLALLARFAVLGLRSYPELNGSFAAQTDRGLVVPVVTDAHRLSTVELSAALARLTAAGRSGTLSPAELTGGTFTVNNYGVFGVDGSAAIINHPEVAILGIGRIVDRPWVHEGELAIRKVTELTLSFDHRVCDGGTAGGFLRFVADCVESPILALGRL
jgi:pyruvate dehydrogenase E2 component (dihydrolipoamide acetyltransferase)